MEFEHQGMIYIIPRDAKEPSNSYIKRRSFIVNKIKERKPENKAEFDKIIQDSRIWYNKKVLGCIY